MSTNRLEFLPAYLLRSEPKRHGVDVPVPFVSHAPGLPANLFFLFVCLAFGSLFVTILVDLCVF